MANLISDFHKIVHLLSTNAGQAYTLKELEKNLSISKSTLHRRLKALENDGYVIQNRDRKWAVGVMVVSLGFSAVRAFPVIDAARLYLQELAKAFNCAASVSVMIHDKMILAEAYSQNPMLSTTAKPGTQVEFAPPYGTSVIAWSIEKDSLALDRWLSKAVAPGTAQFSKLKEAYLKYLPNIRKTGLQIHQKSDNYSTLMEHYGRVSSDSSHMVSEEKQQQVLNLKLGMSHPDNMITDISDPTKTYCPTTLNSPIIDRHRNVIGVIALTGYDLQLSKNEISRMCAYLLQTNKLIARSINEPIMDYREPEYDESERRTDRQPNKQLGPLGRR